MQVMQETWAPSLGGEDVLEEQMETHSSILAWKIPWTEEPGELQSMGSQRVRDDLAHKYLTTKILQKYFSELDNMLQGQESARQKFGDERKDSSLRQ